jgi:hypothetical protein
MSARTALEGCGSSWKGQEALLSWLRTLGLYIIWNNVQTLNLAIDTDMLDSRHADTEALMKEVNFSLRKWIDSVIRT